MRYLKFYFYKNMYEGKDSEHMLPKFLTLTPSPALFASLKHEGSSSFAVSQFGIHFDNHLRQEDTLQHPCVFILAQICLTSMPELKE